MADSTGMLPSILGRQVRRGVEDHVRSAFPVSTPGFRNALDDFLGEAGNLDKGPYLSVALPFRKADVGRDVFPAIPLPFRPYKHQERAFARIGGETPLSTVVATGTGSGKTECFTWPILEHCRQHAAEGGIKAVLIYPMNALANDQAERLAQVIAANPESLGEIRVGLYADTQPEHAATRMRADSVITDRETIRQDPPDILITNYKMLDHMLVLPRDRPLWSENGPETLRYLVVDELHTFDGAQGTDLACLIRRLKARLEIPKERLCCIGTSATLGTDSADLRTFAGQLFGEPFDQDAVVTEDRRSVQEYLFDNDVATTRVPASDEIASIREHFDSSARKDLLAEIYRVWFGDAPDGDVDDANWRVAVGRELDGHVFVHSLLRILKGRALAYDEIRAELAEKRFLPDATRAYLNGLIDTAVALISHARRTDPDVPESDGTLKVLPYFEVRNQLWLRELRRLVAGVAKEPSFAFIDDLSTEAARGHLPVVHCRECGTAGWMGMTTSQTERLEAPIETIYTAFFEGGAKAMRNLAMLFTEPPRLSARADVADSQPVLVCGQCLNVHAQTHRGVCAACHSRDVVHLHHYRPVTPGPNQRNIINSDCPHCGSSSGLTIFGMRSVTLSSGIISTLFASEHNSDPKLLTFSDSVQDAAHRAGFFEARSYPVVVRAGMKSAFDEQPAHTSDLKSALEHVPAHLRELCRKRAGGDAHAGDQAFVATYVPADLTWMRDIDALFTQGELPEGSDAADNVAFRLGWDTFADLTFRARLGNTLERTGLVAVHPDRARIEAACSDLERELPEKLGRAHGDLPAGDLNRFVTGVVDHMRARGAVWTPVTRLHTSRDGNWGAVLRNAPGLQKRLLPRYGPDHPQPRFPCSRTHTAFDPIKPGSVMPWYPGWADTFFLAQSGMMPADWYTDLYHTVFEILERHGVVASMQPRGEGGNRGTTVWGLTPETVHVHCDDGHETATRVVACDRCMNAHTVPLESAPTWNGMPCTKIGCDGRLRGQAHPERNHFTRRLLNNAGSRRVVAREHTGMLGRETRNQLEDAFKRDKPRAWDPNVLSATPTLEMGIDIGALSTLLMCQVPPTPANYTQRVGRAGRRDGNAFTITVATGEAHDLYFYADPAEMIRGEVRPPGVHLSAIEILKRQFAAFTLDRWNRTDEAPTAYRYGSVKQALEARRSGATAHFPNAWTAFIDRNAETLIDGFLAAFPEIEQENPQAARDLRAFVRGEDGQGGLTHWIADRFQGIQERIDIIWNRVSAIRNEQRRLRRLEEKGLPLPEDHAERLEDLKSEGKKLRQYAKNLEKQDILLYMTEQGILPNYAFPEEGVTLKSIISHTEVEGRDPTVYEYPRGAAAALGEFAPGSQVYAEGRQVEVDQIDTRASDIETWRFCPVCTYAEKEETAGHTACPACGSQRWRDVSQQGKVIRLRQVMARAQDRRARIGDDQEERRTERFERRLLPCFTRDAIEHAYAAPDTDVVFGYEYLRSVVFREINFGKTSDAQGPEVSGETVHADGFRICMKCGKTRKLREGGQIEHTYQCPVRGSDNEAESIDCTYLYREFPSEALRILLPVQAGETETGSRSFAAALRLGLSQRFRGKVDHLRTTVVEQHDGVVNRQYLFLYDTVPGGTGYIRQLVSDADELRAVLQAAVTAMDTCACTARPESDGCHKCILGHKESRSFRGISRTRAVRMLHSLLGIWDQIGETTTVSDIDTNTMLDSQLESAFIAALRETATADDRGVFRAQAIGGVPGYYLRYRDKGWYIKPQQWFSTTDSNIENTRTDFLLSPASEDAETPPVAVFLDGWESHQNQIGSDIRKRLDVLRNRGHAVWTLTWYDLKPTGTGTGLLEVFCTQTQAETKYLGAEASAAAERVRARSAFADLLAYLAEPAPGAWRDVAKVHAVRVMARNNATLSQLDRLVPQNARDAVADVSDGVLGAVTGGDLTLAIGAPAAELHHTPTANAFRVVLALNDGTEGTAAPFAAWQGLLKACNILQWLPRFHACTQSDPDGALPAPGLDAVAGRETAAGGDEAAWSEARDLAVPDVHPLLDHLRTGGAPVPDVGHDVTDARGRVLGTLELAWPSQGVGVDLDGEFSEHTGWTIVQADASDCVERILAVLTPEGGYVS